MIRKCECDNVTGPVYTPDQCRRCWKWKHDPIYRAKIEGQPPIEWTSTARLVQDALVLAGQLPPYVSGIAGIPRSGMIPAAAMAAHLHLPLYELPPTGHLRPIGAGGRGNYGWAGVKDGPLVVVDDTIYGGGAMQRAREQIGARSALFVAVYATPWTATKVDHFSRVLPATQLLEWNIFNNGIWRGHSMDRAYGGGCATDFDGILCEEPTAPDSDVAGYDRFLREARPRWLPRALPIPLIVTGRLEKHRRVTMEWLEKWGVKCDRLAMFPAASWEQRADVAGWKAAKYRESPCGFFFESDPTQAERIHALTKKPVVCPPIGRVWVR